jgi:phage baseplate assembly protein W
MAYNPKTAAKTLYPQRNTLSDISAFFGISGSGVTSYDADVPGGEIFNVNSTLVGDESFEPTYGCDLPLRIFEPNNASTLGLARNDVFNASRQWVLHAKVDPKQTTAFMDPNNRLVGVQIAYDYAGAFWTVDVALTKAFNGSI